MRGAGDFWRRITRQVLDQARATGQEKKYSQRSGRGVRVREYGRGAASGRKKNSEVQKVTQSNSGGHGTNRQAKEDDCQPGRYFVPLLQGRMSVASGPYST